MAVLWILYGGYELAQGLNVIPSIYAELGMPSFIGILGAINIALGLGLLLEQTWAQFLIKILSWITIGISIVGLPMLMMDKNPLVPFLITLLNMSLSGFQIYLINKVGDA
jgi:hypothetical protein